MEQNRNLQMTMSTGLFFSFFFSRWQPSVLLLLTGVLLLLPGCRPRPEIIPDQPAMSVKLNRSYIESSALTEQWADIIAHLLTVNMQGLSPQDHGYALYWMGTAEFFRGEKARAVSLFEKSATMPNDPVTRQRLDKAMARLGIRKAERPQEQAQSWYVQLGIFSSRESADKLFTELSWKGIRVKIRPAQFQGENAWLIYDGPFETLAEAQAQRLHLESRGLEALVKALELR